jgi:hypothetical protein
VRIPALIFAALLCGAPGLGQEPASEAHPGDRYESVSRLRVAQGRLGTLREGVADAQRTRCVVEVLRSKGANVEANVTSKGRKAVPYRGRLHDLAWLSAPRLLAPVARELRTTRAGQRRVTLSIAGYPVAVRMQVTPVKVKRGKAVRLSGEGQAEIGETGVTLRLQVRGRLLLLPGGASQFELRLRWTATGGPGADAEARIHLETRVRKLGGAK